MMQPPFTLLSASMGIEDPVSVSGSELGTKEAIEKKEKKESIDMLEWVIV